MTPSSGRRRVDEPDPTEAPRTPRIVSLAPSATATLGAMGGGDLLVGATVHCEYDGPRIGGWLNPDYERIAGLDPELVLTADPLQREVRDALDGHGYAVHHVEPATLSDVIGTFREIGEAVGLPEAGRELAARSERRLERIRRALPPEEERPVVYCEEWSDPPMAAGNWVPDAVAAAGGRYPFVTAGERSTEVSASRVEAAAPDHAFLHVCGHGEHVDPETMTRRGWRIPAIERGNVHVVDDSLLNQPSPKLIDGIETVAAILHPDRFDAPGADGIDHADGRASPVE